MDDIILQDNPSNETASTHETRILHTEIPGFDDLFIEHGIPHGNSVLIAGGTGTGKSTFCRQICYNLVNQGKHCMYVSFEESAERMKQSMTTFGWDIQPHIDNGNFLIQQVNPLDILRMKFGSLGGSGSAKELSSKVKPIVIPRDFSPEIIVIDSLTAIIAASISKETNYRVYLQQLFSFFEDTGATCLLISETDPLPIHYSESGIEEFLADGIVMLYNIQKDDHRENAIEVVKMRYGAHEKRIVGMEIATEGIVVHADQHVTLHQL